MQRWDFDVWSGCEEEDDEGEFVKHDDHLTALERQREGIEKEVKKIINIYPASREPLNRVLCAICTYGQEEAGEWWRCSQNTNLDDLK